MNCVPLYVRVVTPPGEQGTTISEEIYIRFIYDRNSVFILAVNYLSKIVVCKIKINDSCQHCKYNNTLKLNFIHQEIHPLSVYFVQVIVQMGLIVVILKAPKSENSNS